MYYPPSLVVFLAVSNYLTEQQVYNFRNELAKTPLKSNNQFLRILNAHFDIELFRTKPFIWQDIWIYNHLMYDKGKSWSRKNGLIAKYEREIILPQKHIIEEAKQVLKNLEL